MTKNLKKAEIIELLEDAQQLQEYHEMRIKELEQTHESDKLFSAIVVAVMCISVLINVALVVKYIL